jgi:two-component system, NtrC family, sensor kinase
MSSPHATLLILDGEDRGARFELDADRYLIGRSRDCEICLPDSEASRYHASLFRTSHGFLIRDEKSSNGTLLNGRRVVETALSDGDTISIGRTTLLFSDHRLSDASAAQRVRLIRQSPASDQSNIIAHATLEQSNDLLSRSALTSAKEGTESVAILKTLYRITEETVSPSHSLDQILQRILQETIEAVGAERGCLLVRDPETDELVAKAVADQSDSGSDRGIPVSRSIVDYVRSHQQGVRTTDAREDQRFQTGQSILREGIREAICVPMQGKGGFLGVIYVDTTARDYAAGETPRHHFTQEQLHFLMAIGRQSALAIESHRYRSALIKAERLAAMGEAVAAITHHIKNILQGIRGGVYLVDNGLERNAPDVIRQGWEIVDRNQNRIFDLVTDMLSFSKDREPDNKPSNLAEIIRDVEQMVSHRAQESGIELRIELDEHLPLSQFDPDAILRVVLNLVTNALDALEEVDDGKILVSCGYEADTDQLFVMVADNGPGIPEQQRELIFQAFYSTKGGRGTGLGLAVSRKILREHGGEILLESIVGRGTRFTLLWPYVNPDAPAADREMGSSVVQDRVSTPHRPSASQTGDTDS